MNYIIKGKAINIDLLMRKYEEIVPILTLSSLLSTSLTDTQCLFKRSLKICLCCTCLHLKVNMSYPNVIRKKTPTVFQLFLLMCISKPAVVLLKETVDDIYSCLLLVRILIGKVSGPLNVDKAYRLLCTENVQPRWLSPCNCIGFEKAVGRLQAVDARLLHGSLWIYLYSPGWCLVACIKQQLHLLKDSAGLMPPPPLSRCVCRSSLLSAGSSCSCSSFYKLFLIQLDGFPRPGWELHIQGARKSKVFLICTLNSKWQFSHEGPSINRRPEAAILSKQFM